jgi:soluble lytic murein transglycosylase-like protein
MNAWLTWRPDERVAQLVRAALRRGTRLSYYVFSVVGGFAVLLTVALWLMPGWRGTLAAQLMPVLTAAVEAGPARLLQGDPLPAIRPQGGVSSDDGLSASANTVPSMGGAVASTSYDGAFDGSGASGMAATAFAALDPHSVQSISALARLIPQQRVAPDARDDRVLVSVREQQQVTTYLARRYHVAEEPVGELVQAAFETGREVGLDPLLLLSVIAIESGFNPYAESGVGAQGLMQVMSKVHSDKLQYFGGQSAALDPFANIKVGALVLKDCIARGGSLPGGLRLYNGATSHDDGGYGAKVIAERNRLRDVARGRNVPVNAPQGPVTTTASASTKRVQVTLAAHPVNTANQVNTATPVKAQVQDDANTAHRSVNPLEMGA